MPGLIKVAMDDVTASTRLGGTIRPMLTPASVGARTGFLGTMTLEPGEFVAEHSHPYSEEFVFVVRGAVLVRIDGEELTVEGNEAVLVPRSGAHRYENRSAETAVLVFQIAPLAPSPEEGHIELEAPVSPDAAPPVVGKPAVGK